MTDAVSAEKRVAGTYGAKKQVIFVGLLAFCGPGLFNALQGLGGAGSADGTTAAIANTFLYLTFALSGGLASAGFNTLGPKPLFFAGGLSFACYAACIYYSAHAAFLAVIGGIVVGFGAGIFWTAQSTLMILYGTPHTRGEYIALFWIIFNLGGVMGGLLQFGLNYHNESRGANLVSYMTFICIMVGGAFSAFCLLAPPNKVVREDGTQVEFTISESAADELRAALGAMRDPFVLKNLLFWLASNWFYTYDFSGFNGHQFNMRTRGLNSAIFWAAQMVAAWVFGKFLDSHVSARARAMGGLWTVCGVLVASMLWALYNNMQGSCRPGMGWDKGISGLPGPCTLDYIESLAIAPMFINALLGAADAVFQTYALWLISMVAAGDARKTVAFAGAYKGLQSVGCCAAWFIDASGLVSYRGQGIITVVFSVVACFPVMASFGSLDTKESKEIESDEASEAPGNPSTTGQDL